MTLWAVDTSVSVPLVVESHTEHAFVNDAVGRRTVRLTTHSALETYSVLTRLPGDARLSFDDAATLVNERFGEQLVLGVAVQRRLIGELASLEVAGGAVYDALIAITAREAGATLLTRDRRAGATYERLGVPTELIL